MDREENRLHTLRAASPPSDDTSDGCTKGFHAEVGSLQRLGLCTLVPAMIVFLLCFSLPTTMLWYLLSRPPKSPAGEDVHLFDGAIIAVEGSEKSMLVSGSGQTQVSTLYGLAFATIISHIVSITVPMLMGLLAYCVAAKWLDSRLEPDGEKGSKSPMFTPLQYGIMLKIYGSSNLFTLLQSGRYLYRQRRVGILKSPVASSFVALALVLFLAYAISLVDLWLHTVSGTVIYSSVSAVDDLTSMRYGTTINTTRCPYPGYQQLVDAFIDPESLTPGAIPAGQNCVSYTNTFVQSLPAGPGWGNIFDPSVLAESVSASNNISDFRTAIIVEPNNMAVIVPPSVSSDSLYNFTASTYGVSMSCQLPKCQLYTSPGPVTGIDGGPFGCTDFKPAYNASLYNLTSFLYDPATMTQEPDWSNGTGSNPFGFFVELPFSNDLPIHETSGTDARNATNGEPGWYFGLSTGIVVYLVQCTVTSYDVLLSNFNNTYAIVNPSLTDFNTTSALSSGFIAWVASTYLLPQIQSVLGSELQSTSFADQLQTQLMLRSLALNTGILEDMPVNSSTTSTPSVASRYPIPPLATFLALVFLYCIVALAVVVRACFLAADSVVIYTEKGEMKTKNTLQMVQLRLTDPLAAVAEWFSSDVNEQNPDSESESRPSGDCEAKGTRTLETDALDMFGADEHGSVVPQISRDGSGNVQFGLRKRYATLGADDEDLH